MHFPHSCQHCLQGLLTYTQLASILGMLNVQWPTVLQGLFEGFSWVTHIAPKVPHPLAAFLLQPYWCHLSVVPSRKP